MTYYNSFDELKAAAEMAPAYTKDEIISLSDRAQSGDESAMEMLFAALLPKFYSEYKYQAGRDAHSPQLLQDCCERYAKLLMTFDFRETGESFDHRLSWHIRQAHVDYIVSRTASIPVSIKEIERMRREAEK